uniref:Uncharacterized protein n=2 Tax=Parascaris univalens TaxID=6257 RepID=A0A915BL38_PARUN
MCERWICERIQVTFEPDLPLMLSASERATLRDGTRRNGPYCICQMTEHCSEVTMAKTILTALLVLCMHTWMTVEAIKEHEESIHSPPLKTNMSAELVHEFKETLEYLKDVLSSYEEWKEKKKSEATESMAAYKEWLSNALEKYEEGKQKGKQQLEEYWKRLQQHRCGGMNCGKIPSSTPPTSEQEWISSWKEWLHRRSSHQHHKHSTRPAYPYKDEMQKNVEDFFHRFREKSALDAKEDGNDTETSMKRPAFRDLSSVIVPPGNYTAPTIPAEVVYIRWWNDPWFWIIHIIGVLIIVVLVVAVCAMCMQKKRDYQRLA